MVNSIKVATILDLKPNNLRVWKSQGKGDLKPVMTGNGAKWRLTDIRNLVECIKFTDRIINFKPPYDGLYCLDSPVTDTFYIYINYYGYLHGNPP